MPYLFAQVDIGPLVPGICALMGLIIFGSLVEAIFWSKRGSNTTVARSIIFLISLVCVAWVCFAIDETWYQPKIGDSDAMFLVEQLPEVQRYSSGSWYQFGFASKSLSYPIQSPDIPQYAVEFGYGPKINPDLRFGVNLIDSKITAFDKRRGWLPIEEWRKVQSTNKTGGPIKP